MDQLFDLDARRGTLLDAVSIIKELVAARPDEVNLT